MVLWSIGFITEIFADQQKFNHKQTKPPKGTIPDYGVWVSTLYPPPLLLHSPTLRVPSLLRNIPATPISSGRSSSGGVSGSSVSSPPFQASSLPPLRKLSTPRFFPPYLLRVSSQFPSHHSLTIRSNPLWPTVLLFFVSGLPLAEKPTAERYYLLTHGANPLEGDKWKEYQAYLARTSILIPLPPALYRLLPTMSVFLSSSGMSRSLQLIHQSLFSFCSVKRTILLDFPMFQFDEIKDGPLALEKEQKKLAEVRAE